MTFTVYMEVARRGYAKRIVKMLSRASTENKARFNALHSIAKDHSFRGDISIVQVRDNATTPRSTIRYKTTIRRKDANV